LDIIEHFILLAYGRTHAGVITAIAISRQGVPEFTGQSFIFNESVDLAKSKTDFAGFEPM
jgi:hypothetical protein